MTITINDTMPRVCLACLNCYNNGRLDSRWLDCAAAAITVEALYEGAGIPYESCEEIWCLDHENLPMRSEMILAEATYWDEI